MLVVRPITNVRVWGRSSANAAKAVATLQAAYPGLAFTQSDTVEEAVAGVDIVCTLTGATEPILCRKWLSPGCHVNAVGACTPRHRELDYDCVSNLLWVDTRAACLKEPGDIVRPMQEGKSVVVMGEIGDVVCGNCRGRESADEVTVFKSVGAAVEDLFAAHHIYKTLRD